MSRHVRSLPSGRGGPGDGRWGHSLYHLPYPCYEGGPFTPYPELLEDPLFWLSHLGSCTRSQQAQRLLFGADYEAAMEFYRALWDEEDWPLFTVPLTEGHRFHVVYRTIDGDRGTDYLLHHPTWDTAELLAQDDGHFMGPALSWPELATVADDIPPDPGTLDAHARLLLLLPAMGDDSPPTTAAPRLAAALRARTAVEDPEHLALLLLEQQGQPGPAHWRTAHDEVRSTTAATPTATPTTPSPPTDPPRQGLRRAHPMTARTGPTAVAGPACVERCETRP